jgi:hypothetical protein
MASKVCRERGGGSAGTVFAMLWRERRKNEAACGASCHSFAEALKLSLIWWWRIMRCER